MPGRAADPVRLLIFRSGRAPAVGPQLGQASAEPRLGGDGSIPAHGRISRGQLSRCQEGGWSHARPRTLSGAGHGCRAKTALALPRQARLYPGAELGLRPGGVAACAGSAWVTAFYHVIRAWGAFVPGGAPCLVRVTTPFCRAPAGLRQARPGGRGTGPRSRQGCGLRRLRMGYRLSSRHPGVGSSRARRHTLPGAGDDSLCRAPGGSRQAQPGGRRTGPRPPL